MKSNSLKHSNIGVNRCCCGQFNQFHSDFTYMEGQFVGGLRCPKCLTGIGQDVIGLTETIDEARQRADEMNKARKG